jgi:hypothetical protein
MIQLGPIINILGWYEACIHYTPDIETGMKQYISGITWGPNFLQGWYWKKAGITSGHTRVLGC